MFPLTYTYRLISSLKITHQALCCTHSVGNTPCNCSRTLTLAVWYIMATNAAQSRSVVVLMLVFCVPLFGQASVGLGVVLSSNCMILMEVRPYVFWGDHTSTTLDNVSCTRLDPVLLASGNVSVGQCPSLSLLHATAIGPGQSHPADTL